MCQSDSKKSNIYRSLMSNVFTIYLKNKYDLLATFWKLPFVLTNCFFCTCFESVNEFGFHFFHNYAFLHRQLYLLISYFTVNYNYLLCIQPTRLKNIHSCCRKFANKIWEFCIKLFAHWCKLHYFFTLIKRLFIPLRVIRVMMTYDAKLKEILVTRLLSFSQCRLPLSGHLSTC